MERRITDALRALVGADGVLTAPESLRPYEADALNAYRARPGVVVLPETAEQVQAVVRLCHRERLPFVARGSGTGLSGGAVPVADGVLISLARMNRILAVDLDNGRVVVQPGVINLEVSRRVAGAGLFYAPDPSSQQVCTIGGNVAENSGGAHCLKYGFTVNHVLGVKLVLPDGELVTLGGATLQHPGYDLLGVVVGAEGTLGVVVEATLRLLRLPEAIQLVMAAFATTDEAGAAVSAIIAAGILPAAVEMMDHLAIVATDDAVHAGYPRDAGALLLVELDGAPVEVAGEVDEVAALCRAHGASEVRVAATAEERARFWKGRKAALPAMGRLSPAYYVQDGVVPRTALPAVLRQIAALAAEAGLRVANVFHAGDGNLHPLVLFDPAVPGESERAIELAGRILLACIEAGGSITGEHGVGLDKKAYLPKMFAEADLDTMGRLRCAFDPINLSNPGKVFPTPRLCGERPGPYRPHPLVEAGLAELF
ncbi:MAG: FAD-linked oxidase C-terminal domain-containing protein [Chloroflexota bacterium]|nr:FAD-binding protein [Dehalococcoidia bacterium]MDW8254712.1 FAD-linked oxidase C-terminal domain-containing protein [Chloroflexota bacterium]